jgi:hypothetical protein
MSWEENPAYQKAQAFTILGVLFAATIGTAVYGIWTDEYLYLGIVAVVWLGLLLCHLVVGSTMALLVTLFSKLSQLRHRKHGKPATGPRR